MRDHLVELLVCELEVVGDRDLPCQHSVGREELRTGTLGRLDLDEAHDRHPIASYLNVLTGLDTSKQR